MSLFRIERFDTVLAAVLFVLWLAMCWRLAVIGVYTSAHGVLIRGLVTRRTVSWRAIHRITIHESTLKIGKHSVRTGRTIGFETSAGTLVDSMLSSEGIDFKFRPGLLGQVHEGLRRRHAETLETVEG